ncbi:DUF6387 family protein [Xenorhabdus khoisanae]|uniref:DUF6387 family protein n=1 Tax=Xenorhabdus khoisanae TaxID=880157 RepID=UPI002358DF2F|nr:DUF6387 family protein [Xenorhabdus khoisanae]MDC9616282.1 DUF6387 family protein [Xenorhabdus khoisanae]
MKNNKIIPNWFDLDKYEVLKELNDNDLLAQLIVRRDSFFIGNNDFIDISEYKEFYAEILSSVIQPLDNGTFYKRKMATKKYSDLQMSEGESVRPLRIIDITHIKRPIDDYIYENNIARSLRGQKRSVSKILGNSNSLFLELNFDWPDEILIEDIKNLLPIWREELNSAMDSLKINMSWSTVRRKIFDYQVFPIIDLMCWENVIKKRITNKNLALAVFKYGEYDSTNIAQTIKPFIENLMSDFSIEKYERIIR